MLTKGNLVFIALLILPLALSAQENQSGLTVTSNPLGAEVTLDGGLLVAGVTPVHFIQPLEGKYKVKVKRYGYESYETTLYLRRDVPSNLSVKLKPKTRFKGFARSLFIPGWGQTYADKKFKGGMFTFLAISGAVTFFIADSRYNDRADRYDELAAQYNNMTSFGDKEALYPILADARKEAYDAESFRRITIGGVIAVWTLNLLDILFLFPDNDGQYQIDNNITIKPDLNHGGAQIVLSHRF